MDGDALRAHTPPPAQVQRLGAQQVLIHTAQAKGCGGEPVTRPPMRLELGREQRGPAIGVRDHEGHILRHAALRAEERGRAFAAEAQHALRRSHPARAIGGEHRAGDAPPYLLRPPPLGVLVQPVEAIIGPQPQALLVVLEDVGSGRQVIPDLEVAVEQAANGATLVGQDPEGAVIRVDARWAMRLVRAGQLVGSQGVKGVAIEANQSIERGNPHRAVGGPGRVRGVVQRQAIGAGPLVHEPTVNQGGPGPRTRVAGQPQQGRQQGRQPRLLQEGDPGVWQGAQCDVDALRIWPRSSFRVA